MSSRSWLRAYDGADLREQLGQNGAWKEQPSLSCWRLDTCCLQRVSTIGGAMVNAQDWTFEQQDKGAFSMVIDGTRSAKNGFVIGLGSDMADAFGFYVILSPQGAVAVRKVVGEWSAIDPGSYMRENLARAPGQIQSVTAPLQMPGMVAFTVTYEYGVFKIFGGLDPNNPGQPLVSYVNNQPGMGNYKWSVGLYGQPNGDKLSIKQIKKWVK